MKKYGYKDKAKESSKEKEEGLEEEKKPDETGEESETEESDEIKPLNIEGINRNYAISGWLVIKEALREVQNKINEIIAKTKE